MNTTTYTPTELAELAVTELRVAVQLSWFRPAAILERLDLWHSALVAAFVAAFEEDLGRALEIPSSEHRDSADNVLHAFNDWLGQDIVLFILEDYSELLGVTA